MPNLHCMANTYQCEHVVLTEMDACKNGKECEIFFKMILFSQTRNKLFERCIYFFFLSPDQSHCLMHYCLCNQQHYLSSIYWVLTTHYVLPWLLRITQIALSIPGPSHSKSLLLPTCHLCSSGPHKRRAGIVSITWCSRSSERQSNTQTHCKRR